MRCMWLLFNQQNYPVTNAIDCVKRSFHKCTILTYFHWKSIKPFSAVGKADFPLCSLELPSISFSLGAGLIPDLTDDETVHVD